MVETLDGCIMHCSVGALYLIDKYRTEHLPKRSWLRCEIKRRIQANAKRFGHSLEPWMLDELLDAALCYLKVRNTSSITEMLYSLTGKRVSDSKLADYAQRTPRGFRRLPCSDTLINSVQGASFEIFEICV